MHRSPLSCTSTQSMLHLGVPVKSELPFMYKTERVVDSTLVNTSWQSLVISD
jgi:hypothetical protein